MRIFIGNLSPETTQTQLEGLFTPHGQVTEVKLARNLQGQSRGFAFVTMPDKGQAAMAMRALGTHQHLGRQLTLSEARPGSL